MRAGLPKTPLPPHTGPLEPLDHHQAGDPLTSTEQRTSGTSGVPGPCLKSQQHLPCGNSGQSSAKYRQKHRGLLTRRQEGPGSMAASGDVTLAHLSEPRLPHLHEGDHVSTETDGCFED